MICMMLYTSLLYNTAPIHCTPLPLHPPPSAPPVMNTQTLQRQRAKLRRAEQNEKRPAKTPRGQYIYIYIYYYVLLYDTVLVCIDWTCLRIHAGGFFIAVGFSAKICVSFCPASSSQDLMFEGRYFENYRGPQKMSPWNRAAAEVHTQVCSILNKTALQRRVPRR